MGLLKEWGSRCSYPQKKSFKGGSSKCISDMKDIGKVCIIGMNKSYILSNRILLSILILQS